MKLPNIKDLQLNQIRRPKNKTLRVMAINVFNLKGKYIKTSSAEVIAKELDSSPTYVSQRAIANQKLLDNNVGIIPTKGKYFLTGSKGIDFEGEE